MTGRTTGSGVLLLWVVTARATALPSAGTRRLALVLALWRWGWRRGGGRNEGIKGLATLLLSLPGQGQFL